MRAAVHQDGILDRPSHHRGNHRQLVIPIGDTHSLPRDNWGIQGDFHSKGNLKLATLFNSFCQFGEVLFSILSN